MIECMQDAYEPHKIRVSIRGMDVWLTKEEANTLWLQLGYVLALTAVDVSALYNKQGEPK